MYHTQVVFFGFLFGNPVWGVLADKIGRKKVTENSVHYTGCMYVHDMYVCNSKIIAGWKI